MPKSRTDKNRYFKDHARLPHAELIRAETSNIMPECQWLRRVDLSAATVFGT
jgi:hypothetical protein